MLAIVQYQEQFAALKVSNDRVGQTLGGAFAAAEDGRYCVRHEMRSCTRAKSTSHTPSAKRSTKPAATRRPNWVLPHPPVPVRVTRCLQHHLPNRGAVLFAPEKLRLRRWQGCGGARETPDRVSAVRDAARSLGYSLHQVVRLVIAERQVLRVQASPASLRLGKRLAFGVAHNLAHACMWNRCG